MTVKRARLRFEMKNGNFMLSRLTDIETGISIPIKSIKFDFDVNNWRDGAWATVIVPIEEFELDGVLTKIVSEDEAE